MDEWLRDRTVVTYLKATESSCVYSIMLFLQGCTLNSLLRILEAQKCCCQQDPLKAIPCGPPIRMSRGSLPSHRSLFISASTPTSLNHVRNPNFKTSRVNILDSWPKCGCLLAMSSCLPLGAAICYAVTG